MATATRSQRGSRAQSARERPKGARTREVLSAAGAAAAVVAAAPQAHVGWQHATSALSGAASTGTVGGGVVSVVLMLSEFISNFLDHQRRSM